MHLECKMHDWFNAMQLMNRMGVGAWESKTRITAINHEMCIGDSLRPPPSLSKPGTATLHQNGNYLMIYCQGNQWYFSKWRIIYNVYLSFLVSKGFQIKLWIENRFFMNATLNVWNRKIWLAYRDVDPHNRPQVYLVLKIMTSFLSF